MRSAAGVSRLSFFPFFVLGGATSRLRSASSVGTVAEERDKDGFFFFFLPCFDPGEVAANWSARYGLRDGTTGSGVGEGVPAGEGVRAEKVEGMPPARGRAHFSFLLPPCFFFFFLCFFAGGWHGVKRIWEKTPLCLFLHPPSSFPFPLS